MVFGYTPATKDGKLTGVTEVSPGVYEGYGTWDATGVTKGEIVTGLSHLIQGYFTANNGSVYEQELNANDNGTAEAGTLGLLSCVSGASGDYYFKGYNDAPAFV